MAHETGWTESRVAALRREWGGGKTAEEIGDAISMSKSAVIGKARRLGLAMSSDDRRANLSKAAVAAWRKRKAALRPKRQPKPRTRKTAAAKPKTRKPPPRLTIIPTAGVPLIDATQIMCRYPVAGEGRALLVCGRPAHEIGDWRSPFCEGHHAVCYQPPGTHTPRRSVSPQPRSI